MLSRGHQGTAHKICIYVRDLLMCLVETCTRDRLWNKEANKEIVNQQQQQHCTSVQVAMGRAPPATREKQAQTVMQEKKKKGFHLHPWLTGEKWSPVGVWQRRAAASDTWRYVASHQERRNCDWMHFSWSISIGNLGFSRHLYVLGKDLTFLGSCLQ